MEINKTLLSVIFILSFSFISNNANATIQEKFEDCNYCSSEYSYRWEADVSAHNYQAGSYNVVVTNKVNFNVWYVRLDVVIDSKGKPYYNYDDVTVTILDSYRESQATIDKIKILYDLQKVTILVDAAGDSNFANGAGLECPTSVCATYDLVNVWLRGHPDAQAWAPSDTAWTLFKNIIGFSPKLYVVLKWPDGSTITLLFKVGTAPTQTFAVIEGSATDSSGIPVTNDNTEPFTVSVGGATVGANGDFSFNLGGTMPISTGRTCTWWIFITTQNGKILFVSYRCIAD